jgi:hypothetical protein
MLCICSPVRIHDNYNRAAICAGFRLATAGGLVSAWRYYEVLRGNAFSPSSKGGVVGVIGQHRLEAAHSWLTKFGCRDCCLSALPAYSDSRYLP